MKAYFTRTRIIWITLGVAALVIRQLLVQTPELVEQYYSRGLFQGIRWFIDYVLAWLPIPLIYIFWLIVIAWFFWQARGLYLAEKSILNKALTFVISTLAFISGVVFFFLILWGYNYIRQPIEQQLEITTSPLTTNELQKELELETLALLKLRPQIDTPTDSAFTERNLPDRLEPKVRLLLESWLDNYGFPTTGRVRGRLLYPKGVFLHFSSLGLYFPLTGEGHIDAGIHPVQLPHVMAHEMSHGYGFGDEGTCNFLAYVSCIQSDNPAIAYAGHLGYWRTVASNFRRADPEAYRVFFKELPESIKADLYAIRDNYMLYPDWMPRLRNNAYEVYLKSQGIKEGMKNYSRVLMLVKAWRATKKI
ncbi:MAG: DUF3810 domain-containing protein [Bacteroidota bacterium]